MLLALDLLGTGNPRRGDLHQYSLVVPGSSLRQPAAFGRVLAKTLGIVFHGTARMIIVPGCANLKPECPNASSRSNLFPAGNQTAGSRVVSERSRWGNGGMAKAEDYRRYAAECLRLAQQSQGQAEKTVLLQMAETWRRLAEQAEAHSAKGDED